MNNLTDFEIRQHFYCAAHGAYGETFAFYILPTGINAHADVPVDGMFGLVHSPPVYASPSYKRGWTYTRWQVVKGINVKTGEYERYYRVDGERALSEVEKAHFEALAGQMSIESEAA